jgi:hypothetical protein
MLFTANFGKAVTRADLPQAGKRNLNGTERGEGLGSFNRSPSKGVVQLIQHAAPLEVQARLKCRRNESC